MSALPKRSMYAARYAAEAVKALFEGTYERWEFGGSLRRRKLDVGDIEHVVLPRFVDEVACGVDVNTPAPSSGGLFGDVGPAKVAAVEVRTSRVSLVMRRCDELLAAGVVTKGVYPDGGHCWGPRTRGLMHHVPETKREDGLWFHEIFTCQDEAGWVPLLVLKTGPADYSRKLVTDLRARGVYVQEDGYVRYASGNSKGQIRVVSSEEEYFKLCGYPMVVPELRTALGRDE